MRRFCKLLILCAQNVLAEWPNTVYRKGLREEYPDFASLFGNKDDQFSDYQWNPFVVTTEDGWELTLFQLTETKKRSDLRKLWYDDIYYMNQSVLFVHG